MVDSEALARDWPVLLDIHYGTNFVAGSIPLSAFDQGRASGGLAHSMGVGLKMQEESERKALRLILSVVPWRRRRTSPRTKRKANCPWVTAVQAWAHHQTRLCQALSTATWNTFDTRKL
jgi:hypothetical protein